jgi:hypothetical protein
MAKNQATALFEKLTKTAQMVGMKFDEGLVGMALVNAAYANEDDGTVDTLGASPDVVMGGAMGKHEAPEGFQSLVRIKAMKTPEAKAYLGTNREFWLNQDTGETTLMSPENAQMTLQDIIPWAHLEYVDKAPENDSGSGAPEVMSKS